MSTQTISTSAKRTRDYQLMPSLAPALDISSIDAPALPTAFTANKTSQLP